MEYIATIITLAVLAIVVSVAVISLVRDKKKGRSSCGCSCSNCAMQGKCHEIKKT